MTEMNEETKPISEVKESNESVKGIYEWVEAAVFSLLCVTLIFTFLFRIVGVDGDSMKITLFNHERLIITRLFYAPERGDIVIINRYTQEPLVKRIIALENEYLEIDPDTHEVKVDGKALDEPYAVGTTYPIDFQAQKVPQGCVFVMGDNRENSTDSRFMNEVGFVRVEDIMGKAIYRFYPLSRAGGLY
jgi:signal peptidase I